MFVHVPLNSDIAITARIDCIEFARISGGQEYTCLCIRYDNPEELEFWRGLNLESEVFEVTESTD